MPNQQLKQINIQQHYRIIVVSYYLSPFDSLANDPNSYMTLTYVGGTCIHINSYFKYLVLMHHHRIIQSPARRVSDPIAHTRAPQ